MASTAQSHKVFLQKREMRSGATKQIPALVSATSVSTRNTVSCSLCPDSFPGPKELGLHILAAHCDAGKPDQDPELGEDDEDNVVLEGGPGAFMEVDIEEGSKDGVVVKATPTLISPRQQQQQQQQQPPSLNLPRPATAQETKQKFMIYKLSDTSNRFICLVCDKMYTSRYNIRMHMNLHSGNNVHKCQYCGRHFAHKHVFESHVRTHTGERPFECGKCERRFGDRSNASSHRKRCNGVGSAPTPPDSPAESPAPILRSGQTINIAPNVSITPITKNKADTSDTSESGIFEHTDHEIEMDNDEAEEGFDPQIVSVTGGGDEEEDLVNMGYTGDDDDDMDGEEMMIEPDISLEYDDIEENDEPISTAQKPVSSSIFTCSFCNVKYSQQLMLIEHLNTHIDIPSDPTPADIEQGYMVIYYSSRPKFMCLSCGKLFATAESVNIHMNIHSEDNIYACEHCDKICAHKHVYENHLRSAHRGIEKSQEFDCGYCNNIFPNAVSLANHVRVCKLKPKEITPMTENLADKMIMQIQTPIMPENLISGTTNNNIGVDSPKKKANRPPPMLIQLNTDDDDAPEVKTEVIDTEDHIVIHESAIKVEHPDIEDDDEPRTLTIAPKPTMTLLSDEAKRIFTTSAPVSTQRRSSGSNPRAHRIVETENGREYIPDTNSNNILALDAIYPPADKSEMKKGFMLRPVGPGGQQRYICTECGKHYTTSYNVRMHRNIHLGKNLYNCKFCNKEFSHKHVWEVSV